MSTLFHTTTSVPLIRPGPQVAEGHQSGSWGLLAAAHRAWRIWKRRMKQRAALADLAGDKHLLDDIGLSRREALEEADRRFWQ